MNETQPQPIQGHVRFIVGAVTILASLSAMIGGWLLWKGFAGGELLCSQVGVAIGGLLTMLSQRPQQQQQPATASVSVGTPPVTTTSTAPANTTATVTTTP